MSEILDTFLRCLVIIGMFAFVIFVVWLYTQTEMYKKDKYVKIKKI